MRFLGPRRSRAVVHHLNDSDHDHEYFCRDDKEPSMSLTVWRKSLLYCCCSGFTVIGSNGDLVFRVDNYCGHPGEIVLMDGSGIPIYTISHNHKKLSLHDGWEVFEGESSSKKNKKTPVFSMKKNASILHGKSSVLAHVFDGTSARDRRPAYTVEGSYMKRSCYVFDAARNRVAEIKNKESSHGCALFGSEVFQLIVASCFDPALATAIVLMLDQMFC
ncbi:LURP-one-related 8-like protein [Drosera capensis]